MLSEMVVDAVVWSWSRSLSFEGVSDSGRYLFYLCSLFVHDGTPFIRK